MSYITHIQNNRTKKIERVLSFGKFKGYTIKEAYHFQHDRGKSGYLEWCLHNIKGFKEELNFEEYNIASSDHYVPSSIYASDYSGYNTGWLDASDGALTCGFACEADMF